MSIQTLTPKQRKRALKKEHRALRPATSAPVKQEQIPDPWGVGKPRAPKQYPPRPVTECPHVLALNELVWHASRHGKSQLKQHTTFAYCYVSGKHDEHRGNGQVWA